MNILINQKEFQVPSMSKLIDVIQLTDAKPPFAVAINMVFIPNNQYASTEINELDQIEIISPVTGG
jgi:sulfur carrier protein